MSTFTIDANNNITAFASLDEARAAQTNDAEYFGSAQELAKLVASWPSNRLLEIWNSFAGVTPFDGLKPVKKFTNRKSAVARIWKAVQTLLPNAAPQAADVATKGSKANKFPARAKRRERARHGAKSAATEARQGSKKAEVMDLLRRKQGATLEAIMKATGWQAHTVRGFVSGTLVKKLGLKVESFRNADKERAYRITA
jgi:hypothetical protein